MNDLTDNKSLKVLDAFNESKLYCSRMVSYSKSMYVKEYPTHTVCFNCNIITEDGKAWYGDLDLSIDGEKLQSIADRTGVEFCVLREMDARFEEENKTYKELKEKAVVVYKPQ